MPMEAPRTLVVSCEINPDANGEAGKPGQAPCCHDCQAVLDLCQPVLDQPDELLGICPDCGAWHYVAYRPDQSEVLVAHLPLKTLHQKAGTSPTGVAGPDRAVRSRRRLQPA